MSMLPFTTPVNPLLGGALTTGPTGLAGVTGAGLNGTMLPYASPLGSLLAGPAGPTLPRIGMTGTQALADMATLRPPIASMAPQAADTALANQVGRAVTGGGSLLKSLPIKNPGLVKGGLWGLAGSLGASGVDRLNIGGGDSVADQFLTGAAFGGLAAVPFGGPMASAVAAPVAGAINVLGNSLGLWGNDDEGKPAAEPLEILATAITSANLDPETSENILTTYDTLIALAQQQPEGEARDAAVQQAFDQTAALVLQHMQQQQAQEDMIAGLGGASTLALQQQAQQIFEPIAQDIQAGAGLYAQAVAGLRDNLPEQYRSVADLGVARELTQADKLANAYRAQAALTPVAQQLTQYQQQSDAFARQQYQQMLAQQAAGGGAAAGAGDVLTQLQP